MNWRWIFKDWRGATGIIEDMKCWIDSHTFINSRVDVGWLNRTVFGGFTFFGCGTDQLASADSAASHQAEHRATPVVSTRCSFA